MPKLIRVKDQGFAAFELGLGLYANPYGYADPKHQLWQDGWLTAQKRELELQVLEGADEDD